MRETRHKIEMSTLLLSLIAGLSLNGSLTAMFSSMVTFSMFPIMSLVLSVYCLRQRYLNRAMPAGVPLVSAACVLLGWFAYSAIIRVTFPEMGSNFVVSLICVALLFWISYRINQLKKYSLDEIESE